MEWLKRKPVFSYGENDDILDKIAKVRGIDNIKEFLNPPKSSLHDPYLLNNIESSANRTIKAIGKDELITLVVDPDADGILSTAVLYRYLIQLTSNIKIVYHERSAGHGVEYSLDNIDEETNLLIILDSSTNSVEACKKLKEKGMDIIILDHHERTKINKYATIVNPQMDNYPNKGLSGCGVVYKFIQVLDDTFATGTPSYFLDLIACGMYADMMNTLDMENRYIMINGINNINNNGIKAIFELKKIKYDISSQTIGFGIAPLINGTARMDRIEVAIRLFIEDDYQTCLQIAREMEDINEDRKIIENKLFKEYSKQVDLNKKIIVVTDKNASKNFNGLIANRLSQEHQRPAIVLRDNESDLSGSYRSFGDFPMRKFLNDMKFISYAEGHEFAGGISLKSFHLKRLYSAIEERLEDFKFDQKIFYDFEIDPSELSEELIEEIMEFDFMTCKDNPPIKFLVKDVLVTSDKKNNSVVVMGKGKDTVKIISDGFNIIKFKTKPEWASELMIYDSIETIGQLKLNIWEKWNRDLDISLQVVADDYRKK